MLYQFSCSYSTPFLTQLCRFSYLYTLPSLILTRYTFSYSHFIPSLTLTLPILLLILYPFSYSHSLCSPTHNLPVRLLILYPFLLIILYPFSYSSYCTCSLTYLILYPFYYSEYTPFLLILYPDRGLIVRTLSFDCPDIFTYSICCHLQTYFPSTQLHTATCSCCICAGLEARCSDSLSCALVLCSFL